jgi:two-component system KDP operon response regulator KdpE
MSDASRAILIVEDEPQIRRVLRMLLGVEQFRIIEAGTAAVGLSQARTHKPDLVILDLGLPDRDGMQVITGVRAWPKRTRSRHSKPVPMTTSANRSGHASSVHGCRWLYAIAPVQNCISTPIEYRLLEVLAQHIGFVVTHRVLLREVWGPASTEQTHYRARSGSTALAADGNRSRLSPGPA